MFSCRVWRQTSINGTEVRLKFDVWRLISNINQIQFWLTFDIKHQPDRVLVDIWYQTSTRYSFVWRLTKTVFSAGGLQPRARAARASPAAGGQGELRCARPRSPVGRGAPSVPQSGARPASPRIPFFEPTYPEMQRKHIPRVNEYQSLTSSHPLDDWYQTSTRKSSDWRLISNINGMQFWLTFDIKHQPDRVLVDVWYQTSTRYSSGWCLISNINQIQFWSTFDIKHQPDTVLVNVWRKLFYQQGGSGHAKEWCVRPRPPVARGNSGHVPRWARGPRPRARAALTSPAPGGRGTPAANQSGAHAPGPRLAGGAAATRHRGARAPCPQITFLNLHTLKCKENIYLE